MRLTQILEAQVEAEAEAAALAVGATAATALPLGEPFSVISFIDGDAPVTTVPIDTAPPGSKSNGPRAVFAMTSQPGPAQTTVWQAHDVDLDLIQHKLTRHKYCVPQDFLDDIAKMEENVARLGDPDRQARVAEMAANARVHVSGFDPKWTPEFDRYKVRMLARRAEKQTNKEKSSNQPEITDNATANGNTKRAREDGYEVPDGKRQRSQGVDIELDPAASPLTPLPNSGSLRLGSPDEPSQIPPVEPKAIRQLQSGSSSSLQVDGMPSLPANPATSPSIPGPRRPDTLIYPPFHLPGAAVSQLTHDLKVSTGHLNVDELEQLRAMMFDKIWRGRAEWDKTDVVRGMREALADYNEEVERGVAG